MGKKDSKTTTKVVLPKWLEEGSKEVIRRSQALADKPFEPYTGDRVAEFSGDQLTAFQRLRDLVANSPIVLPEALEGARRYAEAPARQLTTERIVDEDGRLGAIADYINPYVEHALQPALRKIQEAAEGQRKRIAAGATSAGAYGDARHGILEAQLNRDTSTAMGDVASKFYMDAFSQALGLRGDDLGRMTEIDRINAALEEQALERGLVGSGELIGRSQADQERGLQLIQALLGAGGLQQGNVQAELDAAFEEFLRQYGHDFDIISMMASAISGVPHSKTQVTTQPNNSGLGFLGSALGSLFGTEAMGTAIAGLI